MNNSKPVVNQIIMLRLFVALVCYSEFSFAKVLFLPINWTEVARVRALSNSEYAQSFEGSKSSACDLTAHSCDVYCCNDPDCTFEQTQIFQCIDMEFEIEATINLKSLNCNLPSYWIPRWFLILCYVTSNSAVLGFYFKEMKVLESQVDLYKSVNPRTLYSFSDPPMSDFLPNADTEKAYIYGSAVQVFNEQLLEIATLELPYPAINGISCSTSISVPFLIDNSWTCKQSITAQECNVSHSQFGLLYYAMSGNNDSMWQSINVFPPKVIKNLKDKSITEVDIKFICLKSGTDFSKISRIIFGLTNDANVSPLSQIEESIHECQDLIKLVNTSYDLNEGVCQNVLVGAELEFEWFGSEIVKLNVRYILADLSLSYNTFVSEINKLTLNQRWRVHKKRNFEQKDVAIFVTQTFKITYKYRDEGKSIGIAEEGTSSLRSGNPGYLYGKSIIAGNLRVSLPEGNFNGTIDDHSIFWERSQLSNWRSDGSCSLGSPVAFGFDASSSCALDVFLEEFDNCSALRERVRQKQESLVAAAWVTRGGDLINLTSGGSLLPVIRRQEGGPFPDDSWEDAHAAAICEGIAAHISIHILYEDMAPDIRRSEFDASQFVVGVLISLEPQSWSWTWSDRRRQQFRLASSVTFTRIPTPEERSTHRFWLDLPKDSWFHAVRMLDFDTVNTKTVALVTPVVLAVGLLLCHRALMAHSNP